MDSRSRHLQEVPQELEVGEAAGEAGLRLQGAATLRVLVGPRGGRGPRASAAEAQHQPGGLPITAYFRPMDEHGE